MKILYVTRHFNHSGYLILEKLIKNNFNIVGVVLHNDSDRLRNKYYRLFYKIKYYLESKFYGFKRLKNFSSEEDLAKKYKLNRVYTKSIKSDSFYEKLKDINPDIIVLGGGWHELIPNRVFSYPKYGCINTHPSLLPEFRGTSVTRWQILNGIYKSGSTIHYVDNKFDTGGMLTQQELVLGNEYQTTPQELFYQLGIVGGDIMSILLQKIEIKKKVLNTKVVNHNPKFYKYFKKWQWKEDKLLINWKDDLKSIHYFVLSCTQEHYKYLGPIFFIKGKKFFLRKTNIIKKQELSTLSTETTLYYVRLNNKNIGVTSKASKFILELIQVQPFSNNYKKIYKGFNPNKILKLQVNKPFLNE